MNKLQQALRNKALSVQEWFDGNAPGLFSGRPAPREKTPVQSYTRTTFVSLTDALKAQAEKVRRWDEDEQVAQQGGLNEVSEVDFSELFAIKKLPQKSLKKFGMVQTPFEALTAPLCQYYNNVRL